MAISLLLALLVSPVFAYEDFVEKPSRDVACWGLDENGRTYGIRQIDNRQEVVAKPFGWEIAKGNASDHFPLRKFGRNSDINASQETIWEEGGLYVYLSSAQVLVVSSSDADDTSAGAGAQIVEVYGLDESSDSVMNTITMAGQSAVLTTSTYSRVFRMKVIRVGASAENEGIVYAGIGALTTGKPATVQASITATHNQTLMAMWTVPTGKTLFISEIIFSISTNKETEFSIWVREPGADKPFQVKLTLEMFQDVGSIMLPIPMKVPSESDIEIRAHASAGAAAIVSATFNGWYE